jgi:hypothetical protein
VFPWRLWCATALIAFTFFGFTLTSAVPVWIDESFIVEYGRVTLAGDPGVFGFHQRSDANRPMYLYTVLGSALQELAYQATAPSNLGPRVSALLGQLAAFGYLLYYFRLRGVNDRFSLLLGLAFLIDPLCDIGWRGRCGRIAVLAIFRDADTPDRSGVSSLPARAAPVHAAGRIVSGPAARLPRRR